MGFSAGSAGLATPTARPLPVWRVRARSLLNYFGKLDVIVLFVWVASTTLQLGWMQPLRYLAAAYFVGSMIMFARQTMPSVARASHPRSGPLLRAMRSARACCLR
jgi:hypothetical protein